MPQDPGPSRYAFNLGQVDPGEDLIGAGADLEPSTLLAAYRSGVFPMGLGRHGAAPMGWWSPDPRGVLHPHGLRVSRSLRRSCSRFTVSTDAAFDSVVSGCANPGREGRWITRKVARAYARLHALGWAHSVEVWSEGRLVGGLYGVAVGGLFAGESMFHEATDASKVALVALCELLSADGDPRRIVDVQWVTPHLASLGAREIPLANYLPLLARALQAPLPHAWR